MGDKDHRHHHHHQHTTHSSSSSSSSNSNSTTSSNSSISSSSNNNNNNNNNNGTSLNHFLSSYKEGMTTQGVGGGVMKSFGTHRTQPSMTTTSSSGISSTTSSPSASSRTLPQLGSARSKFRSYPDLYVPENFEELSPAWKAQSDRLWTDFKNSLCSYPQEERESSEKLKLLVLHYNQQYDKWNMELQPEIYGMKMMEAKIQATPQLDGDCVQFISKQLCSYMLALSKALTDDNLDIPDGLYLISLINILSRLPSNLSALSQILTHPFQAARLAGHKLTSFKEQDLPSFQKWWPYLKVLLGNCCQIINNCSNDRHTWQMISKNRHRGETINSQQEDGELSTSPKSNQQSWSDYTQFSPSTSPSSGSSVSNSNSLSSSSLVNGGGSPTLTSVHKTHQSSTLQRLLGLGAISILVDCLQFFNDWYKTKQPKDSSSAFRYLLIDTLGVLIYSINNNQTNQINQNFSIVGSIGHSMISQSQQQQSQSTQKTQILKESDLKSIINCIGRKSFIKPSKKFSSLSSEFNFQLHVLRVIKELINNNLNLARYFIQFKGIKMIEDFILWTTDCFQPQDYHFQTDEVAKDMDGSGSPFLDATNNTTSTTYDTLQSVLSSLKYTTFSSERSVIKVPTALRRSRVSQLVQLFQVIQSLTFTNIPINKVNITTNSSSSGSSLNLVLQQHQLQHQQSIARDSGNIVNDYVLNHSTPPSSPISNGNNNNNNNNNNNSPSNNNMNQSQISPSNSSLNISTNSWNNFQINQNNNNNNTNNNQNQNTLSNSNNINFNQIQPISSSFSSGGYSKFFTMNKNDGIGGDSLSSSSIIGNNYNNNNNNFNNNPDVQTLSDQNPKKHINVFLIEMLLEHLFKNNNQLPNFSSSSSSLSSPTLSPTNSSTTLYMIKNNYPELQLIVLEYLVKIVIESNETLDLLRKYFIWNLILSDYFYDGNFQRLQQLQQSQSPSQSPALSPDSAQSQLRTNYLFNGLRTSSLSLIQFFATYNHIDNYEEIMVLIEYMKKNLNHPAKIIDITQLLINITKQNPKSIRSLVSMHIFTHLSDIIQQLILIMEKDTSGTCDSIWKKARNIILTYLGQLISNEELSIHALVDTHLIRGLFFLILRPELKQYAQSQIFHLMKLNPDNESNLSELFNIYISSLTKIREETTLEYGYELILSLLDGIRQVVKSNPKKQQLFKKFGVFIKIVTLINVEDTRERLSTVCHSVLRTIIILISNSPKIKKHFRNHIGYDTLRDLIVQAENQVSETTMNLLFDMMVDDEFDGEYSYVIQNSDAALLLFSLLKYFSEPLQHKILDTFTPIVLKCTTNQSVCCNCHLIYHLLETINEKNNQTMGVTTKILVLVQNLGDHSVSVRELKKLFTLLKTEQGDIYRPPTTSALLSTLQTIAVSRNPGPSVYFDFDGHDSLIRLPTFDQWPFNKGFSFCAWMRIESFIDPTGTPDYKPRVFSFLSDSGHGIETLFIYQQIQVQTVHGASHGQPKLVFSNNIGSKDSKDKENNVSPTFEERKWYFVTIVYSANRFSADEIKIFIDGQQRAKASIKSLKLEGAMTNFCIGNNAIVGPIDRHSPLYGQMGAFNIFDDALSPSQIQAIYKLGPNFNTAFQDVEGLGTGSKNLHTFDSSLTSRLFLNYNCRAIEGDICLDNSLASGGDHNKDATLVSINPCVSRDIKDIIYCLGGIKVLLPLIPQINMTLADPSRELTSNSELTIQVLGLFKDMLRGSEANQEEMLRVHGLSVLSYLLQQVPPENLTLDALKIFKEMSAQITEPSLVDEVYTMLLLDFRLWIRTRYEVQRNLLETIKNLIRNKYDLVKEIITIQAIIDIMSNFYWYEWRDVGESIYMTKDIVKGRPSDEDIKELRQSLFDMLHRLLRNPVSGDVAAVCRFLTASHDSRQLIEMMEFIIDLLCNPQYQHFYDELIQYGGTDIFLSLLRNADENVRVSALQVLTKLHCIYTLSSVHHHGQASPATSSPISAAAQSSSTTATLSNKLLKRKPKIFQDSIIIARTLHMFPFTSLTYRYLMAFTLGFNITKSTFNSCPSLEDLTADGCTEIAYPEVLGIILKLLLGADTIILRQMILQEIKLLISINAQNRTSALLIDRWPEHLFSIINDTEIKNDTQYSNVTDLIIDIMKILSIHNFNDAKGYKTLENILATLKPFAERGVLDYHFLNRTLFLNIVYSIKSEAHTLINDHSSPLIKSFKKASIFFDNLIRFLLIVEEFIFYSPKDDISPLANSFVFIELDDNSGTSPGSSSPPSIPSTSSSSNQSKLHLNDKGEWEDFVLVKELLDLTDSIKLVQYSSNESSYNSLQTGKVASIFNNHQQRVILRLTLESVKEACKKTDCINLLISNTIRLKSILEKDITSKSEESYLRCLYSLSHLIKATKNTLENNLTSYQKLLFPHIKDMIRKFRHGLTNYIVYRTINPNFDPSIYNNSNNNNNGNFGTSAGTSPPGGVGTQSSLIPPPLLGSNSGAQSTPSRFSIMMGKNTSSTPNNEIEHEVSGWVAELSDSTRAVDFCTIAMMSVRWQYVCEYIEESVLAQFAIEEKGIVMLVERRKKKRNKYAQMLDDKEAETFTVAERKGDADLKIIERNLRQPEIDRRLLLVRQLEHETFETQSNWRRVLRSLTNERGPWGNTSDAANVHWKLDKTENNSRMRFKLKRNYKFDEHANCAIDDGTTGGPSHKQAMEEVAALETLSSGSGSVKDSSFSDIKVKPILNNANGSDSVDTADWINQYEKLLDDNLTTTSSSTVAGSAVGSNVNTPTSSSKGDPTLSSSSTTVKEKMIYSTRCDWVTPLNVKKGKLEITTTHLTFYEEKEKETVSSLSTTELPSLISATSNNNNGADEEMVDKDNFVITKSWPCEMIKEIHLRRYLLRGSALEIFMKDQTNCFFNFRVQDRNKVFSKINSVRRNYTKETASFNPSETLKKATIEWQQRRMCNFDYLMTLNTIAGRTYNDLTQYPVFPWVIADYTSKTLDFTNTATFRDLTKPIGALNERRLEVFKERFECFDDPVIPKFFYGSHYSSAGIVLHYLIRMEPFTTHFLQMQGSRFDHADRMFDSVQGAWQNTLTSSTDVKELIPEFFYMPEFLTNHNGFNFGVKQNGVPIGDVVLPPWAATPNDFVRINREALESEYVSAHLHEWIELIFGTKQRGRNAIDAFNVFYYLTYEGAVDIDAIEDEVTRRATESQINNFGQTPTQLFSKRAHPPRDAFNECHQSIFKSPQNLQAYCLKISFKSLVFIFIPEVVQPMSYLLSDKVTVIDRSRTASSHKWFPNSQNDKSPFTLELEPSSSNKRRIGLPFANDVTISQSCFAVTSDGRYVISCGHWDNSFKLSYVDSAKLIQSVVKHKDIVTCLAWASNSQTLITGSRDTTLMVWNLQTHKSGSPRFGDVPAHILYGHDDEITCVDVNVELDICLSGSKDGTCIIHNLRHGEYVRSIILPKQAPVTICAISNHGHIVIYSQADFVIYLYSINGQFLQSVETHERLNSIIITKDSEYLITGGDKGTVILRTLYNLKFAHKLSFDQPIHSLAMGSDQKHLMVGLEDGRLIIIASQNQLPNQKK
ncbi:BEACH domain-containing protein [Cavenderia fasciculata]|uniref:BEACH domain-containing protein n=1 Tax=Cavenderia fasciculata TaxID=261658 RepID=F4PIN9_CACFS|nr:BEACH domain-containing protein [Cavenderia fasciculata]EGG24619.1 BEACH domain-containing protein [Cavenderia fasciculata]|eukprot:XP_004362470.1 BEACH domain-containing protein [Cavenderia fasciculata]